MFSGLSDYNVACSLAITMPARVGGLLRYFLSPFWRQCGHSSAPANLTGGRTLRLAAAALNQIDKPSDVIADRIPKIVACAAAVFGRVIEDAEPARQFFIGLGFAVAVHVNRL